MFCKNCGKEIDDKAAVCPHCGVAVQELQKAEQKKPVNGFGIAGFVVALLSCYLGTFYCIAPVVGIVLSAIGVAKREKYSVSGLAIAGLVISIVTFVIWFIVWMVAIAAVAAVATMA